MKKCFDFQGLLGFHLEKNHGSLFLHGNEKGFAHRERVSCIKNRRGLRPHRNRPRQRLSRQVSSFGMKFQMKFAKDFQRVHPRFHPAGFISQQARASSRNGQKFPGAHRARKLETVRLFLHLLAPTGGDADSQDHRGHDERTKKFQPHPFELFLRANRRSRRGVHSGGPRCVACLHCLVGLTIRESAGF